MAKTVKHAPIRVLFRYRDLIAHTVDEHRKVIESKKACWWGWWKRPSEDNRHDIWEFLKDELSKSKPLHVGLFNSGEVDDRDAVTVAKVVDIIPPIDESETSPPLPSGENELVPEYYRQSPFSRAWLKLIEIEKPPLAFFDQYAFEVPPPLRGFPPTALKHLEGKLVIDGDELRMMDATIWRVRPKQPHDRPERFLVPFRRPTDPVSRDPIPVKSNKILHLTDLHFAFGKNRNQHVWAYAGDGSGKLTMADAIAAVLKRPSVGGVGMVILTGDFTFIASPEEFEEAFKSIHALLGMLDLGPESLVVIPGNHDIAWSDRTDEYDPAFEVTAAPEKAMAAYRAFYTKLMRHDPNDDLSMGRRFVMPSGIVLEVCALNSSSLEQAKNYLAGMGRVRDGAFQRVRDVLGWNETDGSMSLRILAIHHHLTATEDVENAAEFSKGFGMAIDAKRNLRDSARCRVHLALHGHRHRTFIWREGVYGLPDTLEKKWRIGDVSLLGGGSVGSADVEAHQNYFSLLTVEPSRLTVELFRSQNKSDFRSVNTWSAPFSLDDKGLRLEDWSLPDRINTE